MSINHKICKLHIYFLFVNFFSSYKIDKTKKQENLEKNKRQENERKELEKLEKRIIELKKLEEKNRKSK